MREIYTVLAAMSLIELEKLERDLKYEPDPWAVGARKMIAHEIGRERRVIRARNKTVRL